MNIWEELYEKLDEMIFKHCDEGLNIHGQQSCAQGRPACKMKTPVVVVCYSVINDRGTIVCS